MALFESYERRINKVNETLNKNGIKSLEEAKEICDSKGIDVYKIVKEIQPICFENACWAYIAGAAIAIKKGKTKAADADTVNVSFDVKNTGPREGDDVPQLYTHAVQPSVPQPNIKLRGFKRVHLEKGETRKVTIPVAIKDLGYWDVDSHKFKTEPGAVDIMIGASSRDIRLKSALEVVK